MKIDVFAAFRCELVSASTPSVVLHERGEDDKKTKISVCLFCPELEIRITKTKLSQSSAE